MKILVATQKPFAKEKKLLDGFLSGRQTIQEKSSEKIEPEEPGFDF